MKYLVMECHPAYAVVLDERGRFLKVANLNYEQGQTVSSVIALKPPRSRRHFGRWLVAAASMASSLLILLFGAWQFFLVPYGSVRLQINPDVLISVNRLDYVIGLEGLNQDGQELISHYEYRSKKLTDVTGELADLSIEEGYLTKDGAIWLDVRSSHEKWKQKTQQQLLLSLDDHFGGRIRIIEGIPEEENPTPPESEVLQSETIQSEMPGSEAPAGTEPPSSPESAIVPVIPETKEAPAQDVPADDTRMDDDDDDRDEDDDDDNRDDDDDPEDDDDSDDDGDGPEDDNDSDDD